KTFSRFLASIAFLIVHCFAAHAQPAPLKVKVGPSPCKLTDQAGNPFSQQVLKRGVDKISWDSHDNSFHLHLVFHIPTRCTVDLFPGLQNTNLTDAAGNYLWVFGNGSGHTPNPSGNPVPTPANFPYYCDSSQYGTKFDT